MVEFFGCVSHYRDRDDVFMNFRGFKATMYSPEIGTTSHLFGSIDGFTVDYECYQHDTSSEELIWLQYLYDNQDIEGMKWWGHLGTDWTSNANAKNRKLFDIPGRPIGFRTWIGQGGADNIPIFVSVIYNACNCPISFFYGVQFLDMEIDAVIGSPVRQALPFVDNYIRDIYGQDCGNYEVTLKTPTSFPLFRF